MSAIRDCNADRPPTGATQGYVGAKCWYNDRLIKVSRWTLCNSINVSTITAQNFLPGPQRGAVAMMGDHCWSTRVSAGVLRQLSYQCRNIIPEIRTFQDIVIVLMDHYKFANNCHLNCASKTKGLYYIFTKNL